MQVVGDVLSDRGLRRELNEDSYAYAPELDLFLVADGMGGHAAGEVASKIVISTLEELDEDRPLGDLLTALREAVEDTGAIGRGHARQQVPKGESIARPGGTQDRAQVRLFHGGPKRL